MLGSLAKTGDYAKNRVVGVMAIYQHAAPKQLNGSGTANYAYRGLTQRSRVDPQMPDLVSVAHGKTPGISVMNLQ